MNQLLHEDAEKIVSAGIHAVLPDVAVIRALESYDFGTGGCLADIAPTMLPYIGLPVPAEMTGKSIIVE